MNILLLRHLDLLLGGLLVGLGVLLWSFPQGSLSHDFGFLLPVTLAYAWPIALPHVW